LQQFLLIIAVMKLLVIQIYRKELVFRNDG